MERPQDEEASAAAAGGGPRTPVGRTRPVVLVLVGLLGLAALASPRAAGLDGSVAGRLDVTTGRSSDLAPAGQLQLLWSRSLESRSEPGPPPTVELVGGGAVRIGATVRSLEDGALLSVGLPAPGPEGLVALADRDAVVLVDPRTGTVAARAPIADGEPWSADARPVGWVDGGALFVGDDERLRRVDVAPVSGLAHVTWTLPADVVLSSVAPGWLVVVDRRGVGSRHAVVDARTGRFAAALGEVGELPAPVVVGDVAVQVEIDGTVALVGRDVRTGDRRWQADLVAHPSMQLGAAPASLTLVAVPDGTEPGVAVLGASAGDGRTVVVHRASDGSPAHVVTVRAGDADQHGWPQVGFTGRSLVHVDPHRGELREVDVTGRVRWSVPAAPAEVLAVGGEIALVRTPPTSGLPLERYRVLETATGRVVMDRFDGGGRDVVTVASSGNEVVVRPVDGDGTVMGDGWYDVTTGRRRTGVGAVEGALGDVEVSSRFALLGFLDPAGDVPVVLEDGVDVSFLHLPGGDRWPVASGVAARGAVAGADVVVLAGGASDTAVAVHVDDGRVVRLPGFLPRAAADDVVVGVEVASRSLVALGLEDGAVRWRGPTVAVTATVLAGDGQVVVVEQLGVTAVDAVSGAVRWRAPLTSPTVPGEAALLRGPVVVLGADGRVRALDATDGGVAWTSEAGAFVTTLTGAGARVVAGTATGDLLVLDRDGALVQRLAAGSDAVEDLVVADGAVVATVGSRLVGYGRGRLFVEPPDRVELP